MSVKRRMTQRTGTPKARWSSEPGGRAKDAGGSRSTPLARIGREADPRSCRCQDGCRGRTLVAAARAPSLGLVLVASLVLALGRRVATAVGAGARRVMKECRMGPQYSPTWFSGQEGYPSKGQQGPYVDGLARPRS
jgi:hypothetical protein